MLHALNLFISDHMWFVVFGFFVAALWANADARRLGIPAPAAWGVAVFMMGIVALPLYLYTRRSYPQ